MVLSIIFRPSCHLYYVHSPSVNRGVVLLNDSIMACIFVLKQRLCKIVLDMMPVNVCNTVDMTTKPFDPKLKSLREQRALHRHPENVQDETFKSNDFFDRRDLVQVRYEMLRRRQVDGQPVTDVATAFGVSRQAFYVTETAFAQKGIVGLLPRPRGPQRAHKCTDEILDFVEQWATDSPAGADISEAAAVHRR